MLQIDKIWCRHGNDNLSIFMTSVNLYLMIYEHIRDAQTDNRHYCRVLNIAYISMFYTFPECGVVPT